MSGHYIEPCIGMHGISFLQEEIETMKSQDLADQIGKAKAEILSVAGQNIFWIIDPWSGIVHVVFLHDDGAILGVPEQDAHSVPGHVILALHEKVFGLVRWAGPGDCVHQVAALVLLEVSPFLFSSAPYTLQTEVGTRSQW